MNPHPSNPLHTSTSHEVEWPLLPARNPEGHKGTFGTVAVVGGCVTGGVTMLGAPTLTATAALRSGCGLAKLVVPSPLVLAALTLVPSCTAMPLPCDLDGNYEPSDAAAVLDAAAEQASVLAVGPGLGKGTGPNAITFRCAQFHDTYVVLDADALNNLAEIPDVFRDFNALAVLTPHPGEFRRLAAALKIDADPVDAESSRRGAEMLAQRLGCVVVLKGATTTITDGLRTLIHDQPNSALATAGTGDVLTGVISGLIAQFVAPPEEPRPFPLPPRAKPAGKPLDLFQAAALGVQVHALAGRLWCERHGAAAGLLAHELAEHIPQAMQQLRTHGTSH